MGLLDRIEAEARHNIRRQLERKPRAVKAFSQPPFWSTGERVGLAYSAAVSPDREAAADGFEEYIQSLYRSNGIVFACTVARARVFAQARFAFRRYRRGRPDELYRPVDAPGGEGLALLERPWDNGTTGEMLTHWEVDSSFAGNSFTTICDGDGGIGSMAKGPDRFLARMRPDWTQLLIKAPSGNPFNVDARVVALMYSPPGMKNDPLILVRGEFAHYSPIPDPLARFRGMSWLTPILRDVAADKAYTEHQHSFLKNGATPNLVVKMPEDIEDDEFQSFVQQFRDDYEGSGNAYKTLFVAGGTDVTPLSVSFKELELTNSRGKLETRIASAAGVHPVLAGLSEGLQGSSLNDGNFKAARRLFVDSTIRDLWGKAAPSAEVFAPPPDKASRLAVDDRDIPFLREDESDEATRFETQVRAARTAADGGWEPDAAVEAAKARNIDLLKGRHTGMMSVQMRPPGEADKPSVDGQGIPALPTLDPRPMNGSNGNGRQSSNAR